MSRASATLFLPVFLWSLTVEASNNCASQDSPSFYVGSTIGYGSTTWAELIDNDSWVSTPIKVNEGGVDGGIFTGYEFGPHFAVEAQYLQFRKAQIFFNKDVSDYTQNDGVSQMTSRTRTYSLETKFMAPIFSSPIRGFATAGAAVTRRSDVLAHTDHRLSPVFGAGFNYDVTKHVMSEFGFQYYTGYGKSENDPVYDYIPFLYSIHFKLAYRFFI